MSEAGTAANKLPAEGETISASDEIPAFADAVTIHQSLVFSIAYHLLHNPSQAEDVAQDVFLRLYRDYAKIQSTSHLKSFVINTKVVGQLVFYSFLNLVDYSLRRTADLFNGHAVDSDFVRQDHTIAAGTSGLGDSLVQTKEQLAGFKPNCLYFGLRGPIGYN